MLPLHTPAHAERLGCPFLPPSAFISSSAAKMLTLEVMFLGQSSVAELSPPRITTCSSSLQPSWHKSGGKSSFTTQDYALPVVIT